MATKKVFNTGLQDQLAGLGYRRPCTKHGHASLKQAQAQIRSILAEQERKPDRKKLENLAPYLCGKCNLWHVGHGIRKG
jgi:hypothetical protein